MKPRAKSIFLVATLGMAVSLGAQIPVADPLAAYNPKNIKPYYLDLLVKGDKPEAAGAAADDGERMRKHLAYIRNQVEAGKFVLVGPLTEENRIRGIAVIQAGSLEEAQRIASGDPIVQSGHLAVEVHPILLEDLSAVKFDYAPLEKK